jgi:putative hydrolase of the HAD superfamily|tara:strand:+ start:100 stop:795 length:696 start_codon:yes stop_codon:yes gene_type:complete
MIKAIAFDADDTLWHNEQHFQDTQQRLSEILERHADHDLVQAQLENIERRNIKLFGYGIKGFTLSMIETAIEISNQRINAAEIHEIVLLGKAMLENPMTIFDGVEAVLQELGRNYPLLLITKGDLLDQRNKIERSGLARHFQHLDVVAEKNPQTYREILDREGLQPENLLMVGNSVPSDILPVLHLGGHAVHIPYHLTAVFERHEEEPTCPRFCRLDQISQLPALVRRLSA